MKANQVTEAVGHSRQYCQGALVFRGEKTHALHVKGVFGELLIWPRENYVAVFSISGDNMTILSYHDSCWREAVERVMKDHIATAVNVIAALDLRAFKFATDNWPQMAKTLYNGTKEARTFTFRKQSFINKLAQALSFGRKQPA